MLLHLLTGPVKQQNGKFPWFFLGYKANWEQISTQFCAVTIKIPFFMKYKVNILKTVYKDVFKMLYFVFFPCTGFLLNCLFFNYLNMFLELSDFLRSLYFFLISSSKLTSISRTFFTFLSSEGKQYSK